MKKRKLTLLLTALSLSGMLLAGCNFQGPNAAINSQAGTYEKQQLFQLYAAAGGTMSYDEWLKSVKGADGCSLLADRRNPTDADGKNGDVFVNIETWDVFLKVGGKWESVGNIKGAQGEQGPQGPQGEPGKDGKDGVDGKDGKDGEPGKDGKDGEPGQNGQDGAPGQDGVGIKEIKKTGNDGYSDIYTIFLTDDSEYDFKVPNPAVSLDVENYRVMFDDDWNEIPLPYYVGTSIPLDVYVYAQYADGSEMRVQDGDFTVTGFSTAEAGNKEATIKFGPASATLAYEVIDISDEIAADLAAATVTDKVPGFASGVYDYEYSSARRKLIATLDEGVSEVETLAAYQAALLAAGYTEAGADQYGDMHYKSANEQLDVVAWKGSDIGNDGIIVVDIVALVHAPYTPDSALEAARDTIASALSGSISISEDPDDGTKYISFYMKVTIATMKSYVAGYFIPADFAFDSTLWQESNGAHVNYAICDDVYLQYLVYSHPQSSSYTILQITAGTLTD